jgi:toxin ParE1/3/4
MKIRWSPEAADDLERIALHIHEDNPEAARRIVKTISDGIIALKTFPGLGRVGRETGSRELGLFPASVRCRLSCQREHRRNFPHLARRAKLAVIGSRTYPATSKPHYNRFRRSLA